jgi:hypothetical protein
MFRVISGVIIILHGLVHLWYVILSFGIVKYQAEMGWTGESWLFSRLLSKSTLGTTAGILFIASLILFVVSGIGVIANLSIYPTILLVSALFSSIVILSFWDGESNLLVQKGVIGLLLNLLIILVTIILL